MSAGQPEPRIHPSFCLDLQKKKHCLKIWGTKHLMLVSQLVAGKPKDTRQGSRNGVGAGGRGDFGNRCSFDTNSVLGSWILIMSLTPTSGKGRNER